MRQVSTRPLWIGHAGDLRDPRAALSAGVAAVVELADAEPPATLPRDLVRLRFPLSDGGDNPPWLLRLAADSLATLLRAGVPTLVCCAAGMSRSVLAAAAGVALAEGRTLRNALAEVVASGPVDVSPALLAQFRRALAPPLDRQPTLAGELLALRPLRPDDWDALFAVASDPLIWEQHPARDRWREDVFRRFFADALASGGALLVTDRADGTVIGSSRYDGYDPATGEVEVGWTFLARSRWGGAFNGELKRLMLDHAFESVASVLFRIGPDNRRSRRAVEKLGAVYEGDEVARGLLCVVYRLTADAWESRLAGGGRPR